MKKRKTTSFIKLALLTLTAIIAIQVVFGQANTTTTAQTTTPTQEAQTSKENSEENTVALPEQESQEKTNKRASNFFDIIAQGGWLMLPVILLAITGLTLIVERSLFFLRTRAHKLTVLQTYLKNSIEKSDAQFREELEEELKDASQIYINRLERGLPLLNGVGNLAPLMGFLGTVSGMITAFADIAAAKTVNAKVVAVGIQEALVTTAGGLSVAVPALAAYYFFAHLIQKSYAQADEIITRETKTLPRLGSVPTTESSNT